MSAGGVTQEERIQGACVRLIYKGSNFGIRRNERKLSKRGKVIK
ncbi:hypothetical protein [Acetivibrio saccincola]|jgi:hypothetical protein|nr:hypothetical protein [Acetivibrio saccincola]HQD29900.1 hypothetical protein [Acetivibrio saccincola]